MMEDLPDKTIEFLNTVAQYLSIDTYAAIELPGRRFVFTETLENPGLTPYALMGIINSVTRAGNGTILLHTTEGSIDGAATGATCIWISRDGTAKAFFRGLSTRSCEGTITLL